MYKCFTILGMMLFAAFGEAQTTSSSISFKDSSLLLPGNGVFATWLQKAVADMNSDGLDDIVRADVTGFYIEKQNPDGTFTELALGQVLPDYTPLSVIVGDLDNNGYPDILTGGKYTGVYTFLANETGTSYELKRLPQDSVFTQASALSDLDNDGYLDIFVCNDDSTNAIWRNNGTGSFLRDSTFFDFSNIPSNKRAGNYGIVFSDLNNDGSTDAYLSKCYAFEPDDSTAFERINQMFINDGSGGFYDEAADYNMADGRQTWVTEFQDIDNDGDMDAFIANHYTPSRLMLNNGQGSFEEITAGSGLENAPQGILQTLMRDFDNDGYVDLIVSGVTKAKIYQNNGDKTFTEISSLPVLDLDDNGIYPLRSFVIGDLNHDGFQDIYGSYLYNRNSPDRLWLNEGNANHFSAIRLIGTESNRSAVGAKITIRTGDRAQVREVRAGESYGISNSLTQYFGLGNHEHIDELTINWPSGYTETIRDLPVDSFLTFEEPSLVNVNVSLNLWLEGAYNAGVNEMHTELNDLQLLPGQAPRTFMGQATPAGHPYRSAPWSYQGEEGLAFDYKTVGHGKAGYHRDVVDWVLISLRKTPDGASFWQKAALLMKDGKIVFPEDIDLQLRAGEQVYIVAEHRNHLPIMSPRAVTASASGLTYDFRKEDSYTTGNGIGQKQMPTGDYVMIAGNGAQAEPDERTGIDTADLLLWQSAISAGDQYLSPDYNMDGDINAADDCIRIQNNDSLISIKF